ATIPAGPALADRVATDAAERLKAGGLRGGVPDARKLLPATGDAPELPARVPLAKEIGGLTSGLKDLTGIDRDALRKKAAGAYAAFTFRLCAESADHGVSCSGPRPVFKPTSADVTGDGTPDVTVQVVPMFEKGGTSGGAGVSVTRASRSETKGGPLKAQVWAEYELPGDSGTRVSVGFDGLHRGDSLPAEIFGTFRAAKAGGSVIDVRAEVKRPDTGESTATVAGVSAMRGGQPAGTTVASLAQKPAPAQMTARARLDLARQESEITLTSQGGGRLDALVVTDRRGGGQYREQVTQMSVAEPPRELTARLGRTAKDGAAEIKLTASGRIPSAKLHNYVFQGTRPVKIAGVSMTGLPADFRARYDPGGGKTQGLTLESGSGRAESADVVYYDQAAAKTVFTARLTGLPANLRLVSDAAKRTVSQQASSRLGGFEAVLQRNGGAVAAPGGGHLTMIKEGDRLGVSGRMNGLSGFEVTYGARPAATLRLSSPGRSFLAAADIDGAHLTRMELSNTPAKVSVRIDPEAKKAEYSAGGVISRLRVAYSGTEHGPTIDGTVHGVRSKVETSWQLGERTVAKLSTGARLGRVDLYVNRAPVTKVAPAEGEDLALTVKGVRRSVTVTADAPARRLDWTADEPVAEVSALARVRAQGRYFRAAAEVKDVPARFEATWSQGAYRFRGVSGPIGAATIAVTNHDGATAPTGPHLAAHYRQSDQNLDASVRLDGLTSAELTGAGSDLRAELNGKRQTVALDADVSLAGDLRFGALGTVGPIPGRLSVAAGKGGTVTYDTGGANLDLAANIWLGKAAAVAGAESGVPGFDSGVSLVDAACKPGAPGCAVDAGPFCTPDRGCFGVLGNVRLTGLPSKITVDPAKRTFSFAGFRPKDRKIGVYLAGSVMTPLPFKARAVLDGLPRSITSMAIGPFEVSDGKDADGRAANVVRAGWAIEPAATIASLRADAEVDTGPTRGVLRGQVELDPVPARVSVTGVYGKKTRIDVRNSAPIKKLLARVTAAPPGGRPGTGVVRFGDVPAAFGLASDVPDTGLQLPAFTYRAQRGENTLDGLFAVQGSLVEQVWKPAGGRLLDASVEVTDLAAQTTVTLNDDYSTDLVSAPVPTKRLQVHAGLSIEPVARQKVTAKQEIPYTGGLFDLKLAGHFGLGRSTIGDLSLRIDGISRMRIRPGKIPFGMTAHRALGYLSPAFEGAYRRLDIAAGGVDLRPDVDVAVTMDRSVGPDAFTDKLRIGPADSLSFRRYDTRLRPMSAKQRFMMGPAKLACVSISTQPGLVTAERRNGITLRGADGPQMVSFLDPGGQVQGYAIDLLAQFMSPYQGAGWKITDVEPGGCGG
ncbi:hypothetical protein, partial [Spongiactinospora gelatinilytica]|uniref:hypothetical protein n=1 Tax=Spongiactinospora gelatinilytica TaxID=2666298 RepID=UPI001313F2FE